MADRTLTVTHAGGSSETYTINRDKVAGVRTMQLDAAPLSDTTTQIQVTVSGHSDLDGIYVATPNSSGSLARQSWIQQGGNGVIAAMQSDPIGSGNNTEWAIIDGSDGDPFTSYYGVYADDRPWKPSNTGIVTITPVTETITVDRTAPVVTSDKAGESRPLLSKVVGGAAAAYSLRDLNDKAGNNKVITTRRLTDVHERNFLAKEVSNGNLTSYANEKVIYFDTTGTSVENVSYFGRTYQVVHGSGFPVTFSSTGGFNNTEKYAFTGDGNSAGFGNNFYWNNGLHTVRIGVASASKQVTVEGYVRRTNGSSSDKFYVRSYASGGNKFSVTNLVQDEWTFFSGTLSTLNALQHIQFGGDTGVDLEVSNIKFSIDKHDVYVTTWYDQSGNNKHATQATTSRQPKIVISGSLVSNGIDFSAGSTATLDMPTDLISSTNSASAFLVAKSETTSGSRVGLALSRNSPDFRFYLPFLSNSTFKFGYQDSATKISLGSADTNKHLFTAIAGSSNAEAFLDGTSKGTVSSADGVSALNSGGIGSINSLSHWNGKIEEILVYASDQLANRPAIEANIANQYGITLS